MLCQAFSSKYLELDLILDTAPVDLALETDSQQVPLETDLRQVHASVDLCQHAQRAARLAHLNADSYSF
jgi:hypothetical protein